ncbi:MAG: HPF/RaiA family ribosome-associated protein [Gammaproteobacteria bacterium]|nr:MAG: HPF/RaiA family ribosome-associated protein [Gammaproteobacteria bacterium]
MKIDITYRNLPKEGHEKARQSVEKLADRHLRPAVEAFDTAELRLHVTLEKRKLDHRVTLRIQLPPRKVLVAQGTDETLEKALHEAFSELARQAERHRSHIGNQSEWKRKARRRRLRELKGKIGGVGAEVQQQVEVSLASLLPRLESWLRHELTYLRASGLLAEDYPTLADVRDEMYVRIQKHWEDVPHDEEGLYRTAIKTVTDILEEEVKRLRLSEEKLVSLEGEVPEDAQDQAEDMVEEEINEFYQPDEDLHIEDLIADAEIPPPDQAAETEAIDACYELLGAMPTLWRRALTLVYREHIPEEVVAEQMLEIEPDELRQVLRLGQQFLTDHLRERGFDQVDVPRLLSA